MGSQLEQVVESFVVGLVHQKLWRALLVLHRTENQRLREGMSQLEVMLPATSRYDLPEKISKVNCLQ